MRRFVPLVVIPAVQKPSHFASYMAKFDSPPFIQNPNAKSINEDIYDYSHPMIPSQISHVTYPRRASRVQICREATAQYLTSAFKPMKISNRRRHVLWIQKRNAHGCGSESGSWPRCREYAFGIKPCIGCIW